MAARIIGGVALVLLIAAMIADLVKARPARVGWAPLATASVLCAAVAITAEFWPVREVLADTGSLASRGVDETAFAPLVSGRVVTWPMVAGADDHLIQMFDETGQPAGPGRTAVSPFTLPTSPAARWLRVSARRNGQTVAHSPWIRVGG